MIHDLDVVLSLVQSEVESIEAVGVPVLTAAFDIANARLRFANGCIANLTASRISRDRVRKIRFFQPDAYLSIDYAAQKVEVWRLVQARRRDAVDRGRRARRRAARSRCKRELADFVDAVASTARAPLVDRRGTAAARSRWRTQIADKMTDGNATTTATRSRPRAHVGV